MPSGSSERGGGIVWPLVPRFQVPHVVQLAVEPQIGDFSGTVPVRRCGGERYSSIGIGRQNELGAEEGVVGGCAQVHSSNELPALRPQRLWEQSAIAQVIDTERRLPDNAPVIVLLVQLAPGKVADPQSLFGRQLRLPEGNSNSGMRDGIFELMELNAVPDCLDDLPISDVQHRVTDRRPRRNANAD